MLKRVIAIHKWQHHFEILTSGIITFSKCRHSTLKPWDANAGWFPPAQVWRPRGPYECKCSAGAHSTHQYSCSCLSDQGLL